MCAPALGAQGADTVRLPVPDPIEQGPPISARRAFLRSFLIPGYGQISLDRPNAAGFFAFVEIAAFGMSRRAAANLREARSASRDSSVATYELDATGKPVIDPATGLPKPKTWIRSRFDAERVKARRTHYEDWLAVLVFNHFISGADAFVAAHLADFPAVVRVSSSGNSETETREVRLGVQLTW